MKVFIAKVAAFLLLQFSIFLFFWSPELPGEHNYLAATLDKHTRLRTCESPRVILAGGSNLAFGIDSGTLRDELGVHVVNMGLNASLGIPYMLDEIEPEIRSGDTIILSFEHDIFPKEPVELLLRQLLEIRPSTFFSLPRNRWKTLVDKYGFSIVGGYLRRNMLPGLSGPERDDGYRRELFDRNGTYIGHYGRRSTFRPAQEPAVPAISAEVEQRMARFVEHCRRMGALCAYSCPPHPEKMLQANIDRIEENLAKLRKISGLIVLDEPFEHAYPVDSFYDTSYHLTREGALQRTAKLVQRVRALLDPAINREKKEFSLHARAAHEISAME